MRAETLLPLGKRVSKEVRLKTILSQLGRHSFTRISNETLQQPTNLPWSSRLVSMKLRMSVNDSCLEFRGDRIRR